MTTLTTEDLRTRIVGAWTLMSYESTAVDGSDLSYPLGRDARGIIMYTADGYMSAQIMRSDRMPLGSDDPDLSDDDVFASAARGYLSYTGPYEVLDGALIAHHVQISLLPNWIGGTQYRAAHLDDSRLELTPSEPVALDGEPRNAKLVWRRARTNDGGGPRTRQA
jgi:Lipocalin-like domain